MTVLERREREFQQREDNILAAALTLFNRDDWQAVTIDQIAAKAEIGKGTVYKHFATKDEIYAKLVVRFHRGKIAEIRKIDLAQAPLKAIGAALDVFWRLHARAPEQKRLISYCRREDFRRVIGEGLSRELDELDEQMMSLLVPVIERGIREGTIVKKPVARIILGIHAALVGLMEIQGQECVETGMPPEEQYKEIREFALRGISAR